MFLISIKLFLFSSFTFLNYSVRVLFSYKNFYTFSGSLTSLLVLSHSSNTPRIGDIKISILECLSTNREISINFFSEVIFLIFIWVIDLSILLIFSALFSIFYCYFCYWSSLITNRTYTIFNSLSFSSFFSISYYLFQIVPFLIFSMITVIFF